MFRKGVRAIRTNGLKFAIRMAPRAIYNHVIRPHLPRQRGEYNGVTVLTNDRLGDSYIPWQSSLGDIPSYETALCAAIRKHASVGETVVIIGGGYGVSTTVAARQVGTGGTVHTYEASTEFVERCRNTVDRNGVGNIVTVHGKTVGEPGDLYGNNADAAPVVHPDDLPKADIMAIDAEGAEQAILQAMEGRPKTLTVESHGQFNSPSDELRDLLEEMGYTVVSHEIAEDWEPTRSHAVENDIMVLTGKHR